MNCAVEPNYFNTREEPTNNTNQKQNTRRLSWTHILLPLIGIPIIVFGFAFRFNPLLVVIAAGVVTGLAVGMDFLLVLETFGEKVYE